MTAPLEYVALADCHDASNVFSSQMAYFPNDTASKPQDVAIVSTTAGQTAIWACSTTSALFTTTNTEFVAQLGPKVSEGEYAGTGTNGYDSNNGGFRCWEQFSESKYTYGGVTCNMVYSCNHNAAPANTTTGTCTAATPSSTPSSGSGLSTGAVIGISVGVGLGALIAISATFLIWYCMRVKRRQNPVELPADQPAGGSGKFQFLNLFRKSPESSPTELQSAAPAWQEPVHEMDATRAPAEVSAISPPSELASRERTEMPTPESQYYMWYSPHEDEVQTPMKVSPDDKHKTASPA